MIEWYKRHPKANSANVKQWRKKNPGRPHGKFRKQRWAEWQETIIFFLLDRDGNLCGFCGKPIDLETVSIDHIKPVALGGLNRMNNLRLAHLSCNIKAGQLVRKTVYGH